jgi:hypothetical protein
MQFAEIIILAEIALYLQVFGTTASQAGHGNQQSNKRERFCHWHGLNNGGTELFPRLKRLLQLTATRHVRGLA